MAVTKKNTGRKKVLPKSVTDAPPSPGKAKVKVNTSQNDTISSPGAEKNGSMHTAAGPQTAPADTAPHGNGSQESNKSSTANNNTDQPKTPVNMNSIGNLIGSASNIVLKAAGILEEEIAKGIVAARQVEQKYTDYPKIKNGEITSNRQFDDLFVRFRKDAHDIIDLVVDFAAIAAQNANKVTAQLIKITPGSATAATANPPAQHTQVPLIQVPGELKAGSQTNFPVTLENDNTSEAKTILFVNSPLTDSAGNQLPVAALVFSPNPLTIQAASKNTVNVALNIPATAKTGTYSCFIQAQNSESLKATLMVKVV